MLAAVDGDEVCYRLAYKYQDTRYNIKKDGVITVSCSTKQDAMEMIGCEDGYEIEKDVVPLGIFTLKEDLDSLLKSIMEATKCDEYIIMLNGSDIFRYKLATLLPYKGERSNDDKPYYLQIIKDFIKESYIYKEVDYLESDDLLSIEGYNNSNVVVCSTDKDLRTVPLTNFNIMKWELKIISEKEARYNFYTQLMIGDSTDNIPSPYLLGEKTAERLLKELYDNDASDREYYQKVLEEYPKFLKAKDKEGNYKTKWYSNQPVENILYEVANLLWMKRSLENKLEWEAPK